MFQVIVKQNWGQCHLELDWQCTWLHCEDGPIISLISIRTLKALESLICKIQNACDKLNKNNTYCKYCIEPQRSTLKSQTIHIYFLFSSTFLLIFKWRWNCIDLNSEKESYICLMTHSSSKSIDYHHNVNCIIGYWNVSENWKSLTVPTWKGSLDQSRVIDQ